MNCSRSNQTPSLCNLKLSFLYPVLVVAVSLLAGCAGRSFSWEISTLSTPPSSTFDPGSLPHEPVAVLPVVGPSFGLRGYSPGLSHTLKRALDESSPVINAISSQETLSRLNSKGVAEAYIQMVKDWDNTTILEGGRLKAIGSALEARLVLFPSIAEYHSYLEERFNLQGLRVLQTRTVRLKLSLQLWNADTGELLWESFGSGGMMREVVAEREGIMEGLSRKIWESMIQDLQQGKTSSYYFGLDKPDSLIRDRENESPGAPEDNGE